MSLFSWLKANDTNLYDESPAVVDVNSHLPHIHVEVRVPATGMAVMIGNGFITDHFHGPYYVHITNNGDLGVWEVGADLDPVAYYPAGNFHSVATYSEAEWADMHPYVTDEEYEEATLGVDLPRPPAQWADMHPDEDGHLIDDEEVMNND